MLSSTSNLSLSERYNLTAIVRRGMECGDEWKTFFYGLGGRRYQHRSIILTCPFIPLCRAPATRLTKQWNKDTCCIFLFTKDIVFCVGKFPFSQRWFHWKEKRRPSAGRRTPGFSGNRIDCQFEQRSAQTLGLVTQTLLVTVLTHALAALMLVDFCFTAFFERSHDCGSFVVLLWWEKS